MRTEQFLDSLVVSKPLPHCAASKSAGGSSIPFGLDRIRSFLTAAGNPHVRNRYIHIAGTSGKTSTAYFAASLFQAQGYGTGLLTSPHLNTFAEYFLIQQTVPSSEELIALVEEFKPLLDAEYARTGSWLSYFEYIVSLALIYFARQKTDAVILEAGLGGGHDATNVISQAEVSILTNIGLDHTHILGNTHEEIAGEKLGILKSAVPLITAEQRPELLQIFAREAQKAGTRIEVLGEEFTIEHVKANAEQTTFDYISEQTTFRDLRTSMRGAYQASNAALAIRALELFAEKSHRTLDAHALRSGLLSTAIPCRFERVQDDPPVILDGAHNPEKITQLTSYLSSCFPHNDVIFVCGFTGGKNPEAMLAALLSVSQRIYLTRVITGYRETEDPLYLQSLITALAPSAETHIALDPFAALNSALEEARRTGGLVCVTGSLYLTGHLRQRWHPLIWVKE